MIPVFASASICGVLLCGPTYVLLSARSPCVKPKSFQPASSARYTKMFGRRAVVRLVRLAYTPVVVHKIATTNAPLNIRGTLALGEASVTTRQGWPPTVTRAPTHASSRSFHHPPRVHASPRRPARGRAGGSGGGSSSAAAAARAARRRARRARRAGRGAAVYSCLLCLHSSSPVATGLASVCPNEPSLGSLRFCNCWTCCAFSRLQPFC